MKKSITENSWSHNMGWYEFVNKSERTINQELSHEQQISNAIFGLHGELGEVTDSIKKQLYQGHTLSKDDLEEEIGDMLFYLAWLFRLYNIDMETVLEKNVEKLKKRYPDGFDVERSIKRGE